MATEENEVVLELAPDFDKRRWGFAAPLTMALMISLVGAGVTRQPKVSWGWMTDQHDFGNTTDLARMSVQIEDGVETWRATEQIIASWEREATVTDQNQVLKSRLAAFRTRESFVDACVGKMMRINDYIVAPDLIGEIRTSCEKLYRPDTQNQ